MTLANGCPAVYMPPPDPALLIVPCTGPQGLPGVNGIGAVIVYEVTGISSWNQLHTFSYLPGVRVVDDVSSNEVTVNVNYPDATHVFLQFSEPFTGTIILS